MTDGLPEMTKPSADASGSGIPHSYWVWLGGIAVSLFGSQVMLFALGWTATATSGAFAGLVLTASTIPRLALALIGGAVADKRGPWSVMVAADGVMFVVTAGLAVVIAVVGTPAGLLVAVAVVLGTADAFYTPASSTIPKVLVQDHGLGRAMAARQVAGQVAGTLGPPLGGVAIAVVGLGGVSVIDSASFGAMLVVLLLLKRRLPTELASTPESGLLSRAADGLRLSVRNATLRPLLLLVAVAAGCLLPVTSLLVPLMVREKGWDAAIAGQIVGGQALGVGLVVLLVLWRNTSGRPGVALALGLTLAGVATNVLAYATNPLAASSAALVIGIGIGIFGSHVAPLLLRVTPSSHLSRVQAVLILAQAAPLVVSLNVVGALTDALGSHKLIVASGVLTTGAGFAGLVNRRVRTTLRA